MPALFIDQSGHPLRTHHSGFFLCGYSGLSLLIQTYGGAVSLLNSHECIHLVPARPLLTIPERVYRRPVYSYMYIQDCIEAGRLLPLVDYEVYCEEVGKEGTALRQMDVNELIKFVGRHPVREPAMLYWKWACDHMHFDCKPAKLRQEYDRHLKRLKKQGFLPSPPPPPVQATPASPISLKAEPL